MSFEYALIDFGMRLVMKQRGRPKLKEEKRKVSIHITVSKKVLDAAEASGNKSEWISSVCELFLEQSEKKKKVIRLP